MAWRYMFGDFCLEPERFRLTLRGEEKHLEPRMFKILLLLVSTAPATVTFDDLAVFWPGLATQGAKRASLNQEIYSIRQVLCDSKRETIRTRPGIGYEFAAVFKKSDDSELASTHETASHLAVPTVAATSIPRTLMLSTKRTNPQGADFGYYSAPTAPWRLRCRFKTSSPYFRLGFKLIAETGRIFGDGSVQSDDQNLLVHIGRNSWDRQAVKKRDLFVTAYADGRRLDVDRKIGKSTKAVIAKLELAIGPGPQVQLLLDDATCFRHIVPLVICRRVAIIAWGDQDEYSVDIKHLSLKRVTTR